MVARLSHEKRRVNQRPTNAECPAVQLRWGPHEHLKHAPARDRRRQLHRLVRPLLISVSRYFLELLALSCKIATVDRWVERGVGLNGESITSFRQEHMVLFDQATQQTVASGCAQAVAVSPSSRQYDTSSDK